MDVSGARVRVLRSASRTRRCPGSASCSAPPGIAAPRSIPRSTSGTSARSPRPICLYRAAHQIDGPLFAGADTHALSRPALATAVEVFAANGVHVMLSTGDEFTPTPAVSHAILVHNRGRTGGLADGIVVTPSHNPPRDGGFKYNSPNGGPAEPAITRWVENRANEFLGRHVRDVKRLPTAEAFRSPTIHRHDYLEAYTREISQVIDVDAIRGATLSLGVDPLGGAGVHYWHRIAERHGLNLVERQRRGRSDVQLHDARLGRANPDGSLVSVRDARADRPQGSLRPRVRVRHGSRSARHRHQGRPAAAESLPLGGDLRISSSIVRGGVPRPASARPS